MKHVKLVTSVAAAAVFLTQTSVSRADQTATQAVQVINCVASKGTPVITFPSLEGEPVSIVQPALPAMLMVAYAKRSAMSISVIDFGLVTSGKVVAMVRDVGDFNVGAPIMHAFGINEAAIPSTVTSASCVPLRIRYANGFVDESGRSGVADGERDR